MNLGYDTEDNTIINITDQKDYHHISLYMKLLNMVPGINDVGKNWSALEFGCGRGGGCYVMENYYGISKITGIDLSSANIKFASKFLPKIRFITSDATTFNAEEKFDLILNLESSHAYSSRLEFFKKVKLSRRLGVQDENQTHCWTPHTKRKRTMPMLDLDAHFCF